MKPLTMTHFTATSCLGRGTAATLEALRNQHSGLQPCNFETVDLQTYIGEVAGVDAIQMPPGLERFECRNNRLAYLGLTQDGFMEAVAHSSRRWGRRRIGIFLGTSTAGILQTELAYRQRNPATGALPADFQYATTQNSFSVAAFVQSVLGIEGPRTVVCSACSSSAKVFGTARRMIEAGVIDAAVVGGVDSLCLTTLYGFSALQLTSSQPCRPFDVARDGISISEAAAFALIERPSGARAEQVDLLGIGESSDAYHMSSPHPEGVGARTAMIHALSSAGLKAEQIDYINLHGTGTQSNDSAESRAVSSVFGPETSCSSTKGATGHALGAAGALEAVICALALQNDLMPAGLNVSQIDPVLGLRYLRENQTGPVARVISNSFGFGGTNCALIFGRRDASRDTGTGEA